MQLEKKNTKNKQKHAGNQWDMIHKLDQKFISCSITFPIYIIDLIRSNISILSITPRLFLLICPAEICQTHKVSQTEKQKQQKQTNRETKTKTTKTNKQRNKQTPSHLFIRAVILIALLDLHPDNLWQGVIVLLVARSPPLHLLTSTGPGVLHYRSIVSKHTWGNRQFSRKKLAEMRAYFILYLGLFTTTVTNLAN